MIKMVTLLIEAVDVLLCRSCPVASVEQVVKANLDVDGSHAFLVSDGNTRAAEDDVHFFEGKTLGFRDIEP